MADTFGALVLPVTAGDQPAGDPALTRLGSYLKAVVNAQCAAAWLEARPRSEPTEALPIKFALAVNPEEDGFNDAHLPALYLFREDGNFGQRAEDWRSDESHIRILWVQPSAKQPEHAIRKPFFNAVAKAIDDALERGRDPVWQDAGDTEPLSITVAADTDSIVLSAATTTGAVVLTGAGLTGARAGDTFSPLLPPTVTTAVTVADAYNTTAPIAWTCVDWHGRTRTYTRTLTLIRGGETLTVPEGVASVTSIARPAQLSTAGVIEFGTGPFAGRGSLLKSRCGFSSIALNKWLRAKVQIEGFDPAERLAPKVWPAMQMTVTVTEKRTADLANTARFHPIGVSIDTEKENLLLAQRSLPDA